MSDEHPPHSSPSGQPQAPTPITCDAKGDFSRWLAAMKGTVAISTYQAGKVCLVGWNGQQASIMMRDFDKPMGMAKDGDALAVATRDQVIMLANARSLAADYTPEQKGRYDSLYLPRTVFVTGELQMHDLAYGKAGLWAVNTRFSCLCQLDTRYSFIPKWQPKFITDLIPEDRCHLNGLAMKDGEPTWVTALGETNAAGTWRENKVSGGVVMDIKSKEVVCRGLCMPHSPRWYRDKLWVLNSGVGELCTVDLNNGKLTTVARMPGFLRGLDFVGDFALVGMSKVREKHLFAGLPVTSAYPELFCGAVVVDLRSGQPIGMFQFTGGANELYETLFIPNIQRPNILNMKRDAEKHGITTPDFAYWFRPAEKDGEQGKN